MSKCCPKCGELLLDDQRYCPHCGEKLPLDEKMKEENRELVIKYKNDVLRYDAWKRVLLIFGISFAIATVVLVAIFSVTYAMIFSILIASMKDAGQKIDFSWNGPIFWIPALTLQVSIASFILRATLLNKLIERRRQDIAKLEKDE